MRQGTCRVLYRCRFADIKRSIFSLSKRIVAVFCSTIYLIGRREIRVYVFVAIAGCRRKRQNRADYFI